MEKFDEAMEKFKREPFQQWLEANSERREVEEFLVSVACAFEFHPRAMGELQERVDDMYELFEEETAKP